MTRNATHRDHHDHHRDHKRDHKHDHHHDGLLDTVTLPLTGWTARLYHQDGHPTRLVLDPGGGTPVTHALHGRTDPDPDRLVLGGHHVRLARPFGPSAVGTITLACGMTGGDPVDVAFLQPRPWLPARLRKVRPVILAGHVWLAEHPGHYQDVRAATPTHTTTRAL
ncbi:hypothetical protein [Spirillospora sp. NPDC029432]|uniref:hypothetical protein n=1 Tax=Spirillospora sp. NPDC029432 TaxID=3154599 RepID=UPI003451E425